jgi:hypothetical protein
MNIMTIARFKVWATLMEPQAEEPDRAEATN